MFEPDGRRPGRDLLKLKPKTNISPDVACMRTHVEHRRAMGCPSGVSECERNEDRRAPRIPIYSAMSAYRLLAEGFGPTLNFFSLSSPERPEGEARITKYLPKYLQTVLFKFTKLMIFTNYSHFSLY
jgi:hypothetical protein